MVRSGNAHHTWLAARGETGGGGGGRDTLEGAVMPSLLIVASMTVTEVTTRIGVVGVGTLLALLFIGRTGTTLQPNSGRRDGEKLVVVASGLSVHRATQKTLPARSRWAIWLNRRPTTIVARVGSLGVVAGVAGLAIGIGLSLVLIVVLNAMNLGAN